MLTSHGDVIGVAVSQGVWVWPAISTVQVGVVVGAGVAVFVRAVDACITLVTHDDKRHGTGEKGSECDENTRDKHTTLCIALLLIEELRL